VERLLSRAEEEDEKFRNTLNELVDTFNGANELIDIVGKRASSMYNSREEK